MNSKWGQTLGICGMCNVSQAVTQRALDMNKRKPIVSGFRISSGILNCNNKPLYFVDVVKFVYSFLHLAHEELLPNVEHIEQVFVS